MAATKDIDAPRRSSDRYGFPVLAATLLYGRSIVALNANGQALKPDHADAVAVMGLAEERVDNSGGATGDLTVNCLKGTYRYPVTGADYDDIGKTVYADDDNTLQLTNAGGELAAGVLTAIDADGTWVTF